MIIERDESATRALIRCAVDWAHAWDAVHSGPTQSLAGRNVNFAEAERRLREAVGDLKA